MKRVGYIAAIGIVAALLGLANGAENASGNQRWVSAWSAAAHAPLPFPGLPPTPAFENQTIRMIVRPTIGGDRVRIRLSNAFGQAALVIGSAHVAIASQEAKIGPESDRTLTFGGKTSVMIPPGAPVLSDPVDFKVAPFSEIAVSLYLPEKSPATTTHFWGQHPTFVSEAGDFTAKPDLPNAIQKSSWYWLADVEVWTNSKASAVVAFGDSITDGVGAKQGEYTDWPDLLATRLKKEPTSSIIAVVNEGIGGNRVLYDGAGVSALARFDRDVLAQPGVSGLIILEGINDIGWPHMKPRRMPDGSTPKETPFAHQLVSAKELIVGLRQLSERAHQHGIKVFAGTLTPYEGADYFTTDGEATRQEVNQWIRTSDAFDGFFDFDAAVRDPEHPSRFRADCDSGDHLHPSATGYHAMADAINLRVLRDTINSENNGK